MKISDLIEILFAMKNCNGDDTDVQFDVIKFPEHNIALVPYIEDTKSQELIKG